MSKNIPAKKHIRENKYLLLFIIFFLINVTKASIKNVTLKNKVLYLPVSENKFPNKLKYPAHKNVVGSKVVLINVKAFPVFLTLKTYFNKIPSAKNKSVSPPKIKTLIKLEYNFQVEVANIIDAKIIKNTPMLSIN